MRKYLAEFVGTFLLVLVGTGAIAIHEETSLKLGGFGISLAFGLIVIIAIYLFGKTSGAHINPAVSVGFAVSGLFSWKQVIPYIIFQLLGAAFASFIVLIIFPNNKFLGSTLPTIGVWESFALEIFLSFGLMMVILLTSQSKKIGSWAGLFIGGMVFLEAFFAGPYTGASMNPARSFGPSIISGHLEHLWIYLKAPILGMIMAGFIWKRVKRK